MTDGVTYEVRSAGRSLRLYTNGILHSQIHREKLVSGFVWDLLFLPALFYPPGHIRRVLVLGVGGGAVIRTLQHWVQPECIVGVELNPVHLYIARRFFGVHDSEQLVLHQADARRWLADYDGPPFNLIIDDLFGEHHEARRAVDSKPDWVELMLKHLTPDGALVVNYLGQAEFRSSDLFWDAKLRGRFTSVFQLQVPSDANVVGAFLRTRVDSAELRKRIRAHPELGRMHRGEWDYRIRSHV